MNIRRNYNRIKNLWKYGKIHAAQIVAEHPEEKQSVIFRDILRCYFKYRLFSNQYKKEKFWTLSEEQRDIIGKKNKEIYYNKERWLDDTFQNNRFLNKWKRYKYEKSGYWQSRRISAYRKKYNIGKNCHIGHDVIIERHHYLWGTLKIGDNCLLAKHVYIDYSGEVIIEDNVKIANGVIIESHSHTSEGLFTNSALIKKTIPKKIVIEDSVVIGAKTIILETCGKVGRGARIGAGCVIRCEIPPYAVVTGNPAKIVGFVFSPSILEEYEENFYPLEKRISIEEYEANYKKYYLDRLLTIKDHISL